MKKTLLLSFVLIFSITSLIAQSEYIYIPLVVEGMTWSGDMKIRQSNSTDNPESYAYTIELKGDTTINGLTYKKCFYHFFNLKVYDNSTLRGFLREEIDKQQVFYLANKNYAPKIKFDEYENPTYKLDEEILLYDFCDIKNTQQYWLSKAESLCGNILTAGKPIILDDGVERQYHTLAGCDIVEGVGVIGHDFNGHDLINVFGLPNDDTSRYSYPIIHSQQNESGQPIFKPLIESSYTPIAIEGNKWLCGKVDVSLTNGTNHTPYCYVIKGNKQLNGKTYKCCYKLIENDTIIGEANLYALLRDDLNEHKTYVVYPGSSAEEQVLYDFYNPLNPDMLKHYGFEASSTGDIKIEEYTRVNSDKDYHLRLSVPDYNLYYIEGVGLDGTQYCDLFNAPTVVLPGTDYSYIQFYKLVDGNNKVIYTSPVTPPNIDSQNYVPLVVEGAKWECDFAVIFNDIRPDWYTPYTIEIKGDTIINDIAYKCCVYTFEESSWSWEEYSNYSPGETLTLAFIREDVENRKVYVLFNDLQQHAVYNRFFQYTEADGEFLLYDFANINNPEQMWQKKYRFDVSAGKITIDGVERNCYAILGVDDIKGYIIEGIGYDGYGFFKNAGDFICQYPSLVTGTDEVPVFKAYKNVEGKTVYTSGDAANAFNGVGRIEIDENAPIEYYNLQGVKVVNPSNGVFIKLQGTKATKVFVK